MGWKFSVILRRTSILHVTHVNIWGSLPTVGPPGLNGKLRIERSPRGSHSSARFVPYFSKWRGGSVAGTVRGSVRALSHALPNQPLRTYPLRYSSYWNEWSVHVALARRLKFTINTPKPQTFFHYESMSRGINWTFVCYEQIPLLRTLLESGDDHIKRWVCQLEKCPSTNSDHLQGYVSFKNRVYLAQAQKILGIPTLHMELARKPASANYRYCTKEDTRIDGPWEGGDWTSQQGKRNDLFDAKEAIDSGISELEIAQTYFSSWVKHRASFAIYRLLALPHRVNQVMDVRFWYGETGSGKTRGVFELFDHAEVYVVVRPLNGSLYYDGYTGQKCVLFDDFYGWAPISHMLNIMDRYPLQLKVHGGFVPMLASTTTIIITSNSDIQGLYPNVQNEEVMKAFRRRVTEMKHFIKIG